MEVFKAQKHMSQKLDGNVSLCRNMYRVLTADTASCCFTIVKVIYKIRHFWEGDVMPEDSAQYISPGIGILERV